MVYVKVYILVIFIHDIFIVYLIKYRRLIYLKMAIHIRNRNFRKLTTGLFFRKIYITNFLLSHIKFLISQS